MKKQLFSTLTLTLALVAGLTACSSDDNFVGNNKDLVSNQKTVITVSDTHGFKATDGTPQKDNMTRALPAQYVDNEEIERGTIFEENDCIGVYVVDETTHQIVQANVPYHYLGQMWDSNSDIAFATSGKSYYAYFPTRRTPQVHRQQDLLSLGLTLMCSSVVLSAAGRYRRINRRKQTMWPQTLW